MKLRGGTRPNSRVEEIRHRSEHVHLSKYIRNPNDSGGGCGPSTTEPGLPGSSFDQYIMRTRLTAGINSGGFGRMSLCTALKVRSVQMLTLLTTFSRTQTRKAIQAISGPQAVGILPYSIYKCFKEDLPKARQVSCFEEKVRL